MAERFLGRARNSQGGTSDPGLHSLCVCARLSPSLSPVLFLSLSPFPHFPPLLLPVRPQPSPGESITQQADTPVSAPCRGGLASSSRHRWGCFMPVLSPQATPQPQPLSLLPSPSRCRGDPPVPGTVPGASGGGGGRARWRGPGEEAGAFASKPAFLSKSWGSVI